MLETVMLAAAVAAASPVDAGQCAPITDDSRRLACYDSLFRAPAPSAATADHPQPSPASTSAPAAVAAAAAPLEQDFGLTDLQRAERDGPRDTLDEIRAVVTEIYESRVGKPSYMLDNGQRWRQVEATDRPMLRVGAVVVIRAAAFGSFMATMPDRGGAPVRLRREE